MTLEIESLSKEFGGLRAVDDVSFALQPGEILGLIGPNGAGKTTCFNVVTGFLKPTSGSVRVDGQDITAWPSHRVAKVGVTRTFQHTSVFNKLSAFDNVHIGMHRHHRIGFLDLLVGSKRYRHEETSTAARAHEVLASVGMADLAGHQASELSYGQQRRLALAVALASEPRYLLLDEPAAGLNQQETRELASTLNHLRASNFGILLVEHDMRIVMDTCDRIVVLAFGRQLAQGTPDEVRNNPKVIEAYLGRRR